ncbi:MAG TPA: hypothetical protein VIS06_00120 [Mycobacteriales bacterium]
MMETTQPTPGGRVDGHVALYVRDNTKVTVRRNDDCPVVEFGHMDATVHLEGGSARRLLDALTVLLADPSAADIEVALARIGKYHAHAAQVARNHLTNGGRFDLSIRYIEQIALPAELHGDRETVLAALRHAAGEVQA